MSYSRINPYIVFITVFFLFFILLLFDYDCFFDVLMDLELLSKQIITTFFKFVCHPSHFKATKVLIHK